MHWRVFRVKLIRRESESFHQLGRIDVDFLCPIAPIMHGS